MSQRNLRRLVPTLLVALSVGFTAAAQSDNELSKNDKKWLDQEVGALVTAQEIKIFTDIDKDDRKLFKKIFWSRRDPNPASKDNEFKKEFERRVKQANKEYKVKGMKGSATDMGKIFCLLGAPGRVEGDTQAATWVYDPNPQHGIPDGLTLQFKANRMVQTEDLDKALERAKTRNIANATVMYSRDMEGRLMEPRGSFDPASPANQILAALRETKAASLDVPFETTIAFFRASEGSIYIPIQFEVDEAPLTWQGDSTDLTVFGSVENTDGFTIYQFEEPAKVSKTNDGRTLFEVPVQLMPGRYKLYLGVRDNPSSTAGTQITDIEVPDYFSGDLVMSTVVLFNKDERVKEPPGTPGHAFQLGANKFQPTRKFSKKDSLNLVFHVYGIGVDASGKSNITGQQIFSRNGKLKGKTSDNPLQVTPDGLAGGQASIALNLPNFDQPGKWKVQVKVTDHILSKTLTQDVEFVLEGETVIQ